MDEAIIRFVRRQHHLLIGEANAERIKIEAGSASPVKNGRATEIHIRGRDVRQGRPKSVVLSPVDVANALSGTIDEISEFVQRALEDLPPEIATDICDRGIHLTGGGALLDKLDIELERQIGVKFHRPEDPTHCVVKGTAVVLQQLRAHEHLLIKP